MSLFPIICFYISYHISPREHGNSVDPIYMEVQKIAAEIPNEDAGYFD
jgi:hypothetical protein